MNLFHNKAGFFIFDKEENFNDLAVFFRYRMERLSLN